MLIHIGLFVYLLVQSCSGQSLGNTAYPLNDDNNIERRIITVCTDYGSDQTKQVYVHEVVHACLHNHMHHFKTKKELEEHVKIVPEQDEESLVTNLSYCMVGPLENKEALGYLGIQR